MNIVNEKIHHIMFGDGTVINQEEGRISVQFSEKYGLKLFLYPDAFEKYLVLDDFDMESGILDELHYKKEQIEDERVRKQHESEELAKSMMLIKPKSSAQRKKTSGKSKASKQKDKIDIAIDEMVIEEIDEYSE